ncbi:hypothetical protein EDC96DRAFT_549524 [Choanephora cucurbitarum]|nr:hypothetical protein EDC96DRAFT_549524 [Choanephora cucurbitarum]
MKVDEGTEINGIRFLELSKSDSLSTGVGDNAREYVNDLLYLNGESKPESIQFIINYCSDQACEFLLAHVEHETCKQGCYLYDFDEDKEKEERLQDNSNLFDIYCGGVYEQMKQERVFTLPLDQVKQLLTLTSHKVNDNDATSEDEAGSLPNEEKSRLIRSDLSTCARYLDRRLRALKSTWRPPYGPFSWHKCRTHVVKDIS